MPSLEDIRTWEKIPFDDLAPEDLWPVFDASQNRLRAITEAERTETGTYDGEPSNYVANVNSTATWTVGSTEVTLTALVDGTAGDISTFNIKDPATLEPAEGPNRPEATAAANGNEIDVWPATDGGDKASAEITTSGTAMSVTHFKDSTEGNDETIEFALREFPLTAFDDTAVLPSKALAASYSDETGTLSIHLGTAAGVTAAKLTLTESVVASGGSLKIEQRAAYIGSWANNRVDCAVSMEGVSTPLSVDVSLEGGLISIVVNLATTSEGLPDAAANTDTAVVAKIQEAMDAFAFALDTATNLGQALLCTRLSDGSKIFSSPNVPVVMGSGGANTAGVDALADNTANAVAFVKTAIEGLEVGDDDFDVTADGTGHVSGATTETFAGGGENYSPISTVNEVIAAVEALPAEDQVFTFAIAAGDGTDVVPIGGDVATFSGGVDEVLGTPAKLGRLATDGTDVWMALKDDNTVTQDGWVKIFTGGA